MEQRQSIDRNRRYTVEEYFQIEAASEERYEYTDGLVLARSDLLAMSGGSLEHSIIIANLVGEMRARLKGKPCQAFESNLRVKIGKRIRYFYPDAGVIYGKPVMDEVPGAGQSLTNPRVIIEVTSPSTEARDRTTKFGAYRDIESLEEYLLVSQDAPRVESFLRQPDRTWSFAPTTGLTSVAQVRCIGIDLPLAEVYAGVEFTADEAEAG